MIKLSNPHHHSGNWGFNNGEPLERCLEKILLDNRVIGNYWPAVKNLQCSPNGTFTATLVDQKGWTRGSAFDAYEWSPPTKPKEVQIQGVLKINAYITSTMSYTPTLALRSEIEIMYEEVDSHKHSAVPNT